MCTACVFVCVCVCVCASPCECVCAHACVHICIVSSKLPPIFLYLDSCLGSAQQLKNKYGSGYVLEVKISQSDVARTNALHQYITTLIPEAERIEHFQDRAIYRISQSAVCSVAKIFKSLQQSMSPADSNTLSHSINVTGTYNVPYSQRVLTNALLIFC